MKFDHIHNKGQAQLFKIPLLEQLTKTRPWVIYSIYIPLCSYLLFLSYSEYNYSPAFMAGLFSVAFFSWTLFEYVAHRFLFHYEARSKIGQRIIYIFHGNHHEYPRDRTRLFMPPLPSILFAALIYCILWSLIYLITGTGTYTLIFFPGFISGYLVYVSMHYAIHAFTPPKLLKALWRNHHMHHYKFPDKGYGVSSPLWDVIFRTLPRNTRPHFKKDTQEESIDKT